MAFENLFLRTKKSIGGIQLDAVLVESHDSSVTLTRNPVEFGADTTDNAVIQPKKITIQAVVSDTPLGAAALGQIVDTVTGLFGTSTAKNITRSNAAYNALIQLQEAREPLEIQTKLKLYTDMVITNVRVVQDKDNSRSVTLLINLEEVLIVESQLVQLDVDSLLPGTTAQQGASAEQKGRVEPVTPKPAVSKSVLKSITGWLGS